MNFLIIYIFKLTFVIYFSKCFIFKQNKINNINIFNIIKDNINKYIYVYKRFNSIKNKGILLYIQHLNEENIDIFDENVTDNLKICEKRKKNILTRLIETEENDKNIENITNKENEKINENNYNLKEKDNIKKLLKETKKHCNYLTRKLARLNKKLRQIKKLEVIFYANPSILTETQKVKISKKKQIKNEIVIINRFRKKYLIYKKNLIKNKNDLSPFFYSKKKIKQKRKICTQQEFKDILNSINNKPEIERIKKLEIEKIPKNITDYLVFNKIGTKEEIKILFGLKAIEVNGNIIDDENYMLNIKDDKIKVFGQDVHIHEDHYIIRKRLTKQQKNILNERKKENILEAKKEIKAFEKFLNIKYI